MGVHMYARAGSGTAAPDRDTHDARRQELGQTLYAQTIPTLQPAQAARFWSRVDRSGGPEACWSWHRPLDTTGYGRFAVGGRIFKAHRVAYTVAIGPIPHAHEVKQTCGDRACVNPAHLRLVSPSEYRARLAARHRGRTHCPQGHPYDGDNTYTYRGMRRCRSCQRERSRLGYHRRKSPSAPGGTPPSRRN